MQRARAARRGVVAAGHEVTASAAAEVLSEGGNAFDAVIAALCAACVAEPVLASPGGGGFLLACPAGGEPLLYDFFAQTPGIRRGDQDFSEITVDFGVARQAFHVGLGAAAVPGFVKGLFAVHRAQGSLPMTRLIEPAVRAAREGVALTRYQAYLLEVVGPIYRLSGPVRELFCHDDGGGERLKREGERYGLRELADTLEALAREGDALFYEGELARRVAALCREGGGHLTLDDLAAYQAVAREPLIRRYRDATLWLNPPPSAGGLLIAFGLAQLGRRDLGALERGGPDQALALVEAMDATNRARAAVLADGVARPELLDQELVERFAREVAPAPASTRGTTHVSVLDGQGGAASATVSNGEGCGHLVPGAGFMLNNMLGEADLCAGEAGRWAPGRRMSSMMAPTAAGWDDGAFAVLGSGGSNRIRTALLQVLSLLIDYRLTPAEAVGAPRLHLEGGRLDFEPQRSPATQERLELVAAERCAWPSPNMFFGGVHAAMRTASGELVGAGDERRAGLVVTR